MTARKAAAAPADKAAETTETVPATETTTVAPKAANHFDAATLAAIRTAAVWQPLDGETITGELVAVVKRNNSEVGDYPCAIVRQGEASKLTAVHAYHDDLPAELRAVGAKRGDEVTVLYTSKRSAKRAGKDNASYSVVPANGGELDIYEL